MSLKRRARQLTNACRTHEQRMTQLAARLADASTLGDDEADKRMKNAWQTHDKRMANA